MSYYYEDVPEPYYYHTVPTHYDPTPADPLHYDDTSYNDTSYNESTAISDLSYYGNTPSYDETEPTDVDGYGDFETEGDGAYSYDDEAELTHVDDATT
jgi:hypothetical protein